MSFPASTLSVSAKVYRNKSKENCKEKVQGVTHIDGFLSLNMTGDGLPRIVCSFLLVTELIISLNGLVFLISMYTKLYSPIVHSCCRFAFIFAIFLQLMRTR
jgi:hypothetical protein